MQLFSWPPLLMVICSEMRKLCPSYSRQSRYSGEWHSTGPERWVQGNTEPFAVPPGRCDFSFQRGLSGRFPSCYEPRRLWRLHHPDLYFYWISFFCWRSLTPPSELGQESDICGRWGEEKKFYVEKTDEKRRMKKVEQTNIPTPCRYLSTPLTSRFAFQNLQHVLISFFFFFFFWPSFLFHCNLF